MAFRGWNPTQTSQQGKSSSDLVDTTFRSLKKALDRWWYGIVNVRDVGAAGDGIRDDTIFFKQAITEATASNKALYIPAGRYLITDQLTATVDQAFNIYGDGPNNTILYFTSDQQGIKITVPLRYQTTIRDLTIETDSSSGLLISSITRSGTTATVTTSSAHGYATGDVVVILNAEQLDYNGEYTITVTSATTFTYTVANSPTTPATGTIYSLPYYPALYVKCSTWSGNSMGSAFISNLVITSQRNSATGIFAAGLKLENLYVPFVENVAITGTGNREGVTGIDLVDCVDLHFRGVTVVGYDTGLRSRYVAHQLEGVLMTDCEFYSVNKGIDVDTAIFVNMTNGHIAVEGANPQYCIRLSGVAQSNIYNNLFYYGSGNTTGHSVTSITRSGATATVTTSVEHGHTTGDTVLISGATQTEYNGQVVITVTSKTTFTYTVSGTPASPATGTIYQYRSVDGIRLENTTFDNIISTNTFQSLSPYNVRTGIRCYNAGSRNKIINNNFNGLQAPQYAVTCVGSTDTLNAVVNNEITAASGALSEYTADSNQARGNMVNGFVYQNRDKFRSAAFTPTLLFGGANTGMTYTIQAGRYTRVGNLVTINAVFVISNKGASTGDVTIGSLPYTVRNDVDSYTPVTVRVEAVSYTGQLQGFASAGTNTLVLEYQTEGGIKTNLNDTNIIIGSAIMVSCSYHTDDAVY